MANVGELSVTLSLDDAQLLSGLDAAQASLQGFADALAQLDLPEGLLGGNLLPDGGAGFAEAGASAGAAFSEELTAALGGEGAAVAVGALAEELLSAGEPLLSAGAQALAQRASEAMAGTSEALTASILTAFAGASAPLAQAGTELARAYASGVSLGAPLALAGGSALASAAASGADSGLDGASGLGGNFASGLAAGIRSGRSGVVSAAVAVARAAAEAARSALDIHSPSRVTEALGEYFDRGFIEGVEGMTPDIERAVRAAVRVEPGLSTTYGLTQVAPPAARASVQPIDYEALASAMDRRQVVLTMNGRRVAEVQGQDNARVQSARNRRVALGYGK